VIGVDFIEVKRLNFYRASELHGGLVLGQLVRRVRDPRLMLSLTRHSAEEIAHAQLWTETILAVGGRPAPVRATYQQRLAQRVGAVSSVFQVLALTQVFERRVYRHFIDHARLAGTHPTVRAMLDRMVEEEKEHLSWVRDWLEEEAESRGVVLKRVLREYAATDRFVYDELLREYGFTGARQPRTRAARRVAQ
jgi:demethoxyubiquinone hydroxylase (CLK1/Coq7/Cat5 family)